MNCLSISDIRLLPGKDGLAAVSDLAFEEWLSIEKLQPAVEAKDWKAVVAYIGDMIDKRGTQVMGIVLMIGKEERQMREVANMAIEALTARPSRGVNRSHLAKVRAAILETVESGNLLPTATQPETARLIKRRHGWNHVPQAVVPTPNPRLTGQIRRREARLASPRTIVLWPTVYTDVFDPLDPLDPFDLFNQFDRLVALGDTESAISLALEVGGDLLNSGTARSLFERHWLSDTQPAAA